MDFKLKRGKISDIHVELGESFKKSAPDFAIFDFIQTHGLPYSFIEDDSFQALNSSNIFPLTINIYLDPARVRKSKKSKQSQDMDDLLNKYCFSGEKGKSKIHDPTPKPKNSVLKAQIFYVNSQNIKKIISYIDNMPQNSDAKQLILFDGINGMVLK